MKELEVLRYSKQENGTCIDVSVITDDIDSAWARFKGRLNYRAEMTGVKVTPFSYCKYSASDNYQLYLHRYADIPSDLTAELNANLWPVIYETSDYWISVHLQDVQKDSARVQHVRADVENAFKAVWDSNGKECTISGKVSFLNEPGLFRLSIVYAGNDGKQHSDFISFPVVSPKLDVKNDYTSILYTVNREIEQDVFRYLSLTIQQMSPSRDRSKDLEVWMQVFDDLAQDYIKNVAQIIKNPHSRSRTITEYRKAERIHKWTPAMEELYAEKEQAQTLNKYYFRNEVYDRTVNSMENRFVKYTLHAIGKRLEEVFSKVLSKANTEVSDSLRSKWAVHQSDIAHLLKHPFFENVGRFEGLQHESLVLQNRRGYQQVYKDFLKLKKGIDIFDGLLNIGVKQIWEIYELWCFIKIKQMVRRILGADGKYELQDDEPNGSLITYSQDKKEDYTYLLYYPGTSDKYITLHYQHKYNRRSGELRTYTTDNRPDIVLNIHQAGSDDLTYLFDAKYRVWSDPQLDRDMDELDAEEWENGMQEGERLRGADYPPSDAINQMHRYRDAIYYSIPEEKRPVGKEIIGGYILFPGRVSGNVSRYFSLSIKKVNIGAFPLLPFGQSNKEQNTNPLDIDPEGQELYGYLKTILLQKEDVYSHVKDSIPQRGLEYKKAIKTHETLVILNQASHDKLAIMKQKMICYVRAAFEQGSLRLIPGYEDTRYALLNDGKYGELFELKGEGPRFAPKHALAQELGLEEAQLSHEYYLVFDLKSNTPIQKDISVPSQGRGTSVPHFIRLKDLNMQI